MEHNEEEKSNENIIDNNTNDESTITMTEKELDNLTLDETIQSDDKGKGTVENEDLDIEFEEGASEGVDYFAESEVESENLENSESTESGESEDIELPDDSEQGFFEHSDSIYSVSVFAYDETVLAASGGGDDKAFIWDATNGECKAELSGHTDSVIAVGFNRDGTLLATAGLDSLVKIWNVNTGELLQTLEGPTEGIEWIKWHPKGNVVVAGATDGTCWMWLATSGACMNVFVGHSGAVTCGGFTPDGKKLCTASADSSFRVWNPRTAQTTQVINDHTYHHEGVLSMAFHNDKPIAMTGSQDQTAAIVNILTGKVVSILRGHTDSVESVGFCSSLALGATASMDHALKIWDINTGQLRQTCNGHDDGIVKLQWHNTLPFIYSCSVDRTVKLWDARTGQCVTTWKGHQDTILDFAVIPDGHVLVTGSDDDTSLVFTVDERIFS